jgi:hypothetical protein
LRTILLTVLVLALLAGTAVAFAMTEALKLERSPVTAPDFDETFSPTCGCKTRTASLSFRLRRADRLDLVVVSGEEEIRTLADDVEHQKGRVTVRWDGRDEAGAVVPDGVYRLQVHLDDARRTIVVPNEVEVDTRPPELEVVDVAPAVFSPDGDGRRDKVEMRFRTSEKAWPLMLVDGEIAAEPRWQRKGERSVAWNGRVQERPLRAGTYALSLRLRDEAGNLSPAGDALPVRIRFVEVEPRMLVVRRGTRLAFRVVTDAAGITWQLLGPRGRVVRADARAAPGRLAPRLPRSLRPGRYVFVVTANGHSERALVLVMKRRR